MSSNKVFGHAMKLFAILLITALMGCGNKSANNNESTSGDEAKGEPQKGGTLNVAFSADPDTLDWMYSGATSTKLIGWHIFENLFSLDSNYKVRPMLAKSYELSDDGTTYTIELREGVTFHDGSTLTAEDAVASINRWRKVSSVGEHADKYIERVSVIDDYTLQVKLKEKYTALLSDMASPKSALMVIPAEIAKAAGEKPLSPDQIIGTGPYKFESWERGNEIVLTRFEDYSALEKEVGGLAGKKVAYIEQINFKIVKDPQTMINGVKTGLYDYAQSIPPDLYQVIKANEKIDPVTYINGYSIFTIDHSEPPFNDLKVRKAMNYALNKKKIAASTYGNEEFYAMDGALFSPKQKELYTDEGTKQYLAYDPEKAKQLLKESSYNGEPITIMFPSNYADFEKSAEVAKQQLEAAGFKVELVSYEWATFLEKWSDPANWDVISIGWATLFSPNQLGMLSMDSSGSGWWHSERWASLLERWGSAETQGERKEILAEMNQTVYDEMVFIKIANESTLDIKSPELKGYTSWIGLRFWNTWIKE